MITDIGGAIVAHQLRLETAYRTMRKTTARRSYTEDRRAAAAVRF